MNTYPMINNDKIVILNDYSNTADGKEMVLDFSEIENDQIKKEAMDYVLRKYNARAVSPMYLKVLVPAIRHFDTYAKAKGLSSFFDYTADVSDDYQLYLQTLLDEDGKLYSENYQGYLWSVPRRIKKELARE